MAKSIFVKSGAPAFYSTDTAAPEKVALPSDNPDTSAASSGSTTGPILATASRLIEQIGAARIDHGAANDDLETVCRDFYEEAPVGTMLGTNVEVAAGFAQAMFGVETVPSVEPETWSAENVQVAFQIAQVYLISANRRDGAATMAMEALALAVQRRNVAALPSIEEEEMLTPA